MPRLTQANYTSRRIKLVAALEGARNATTEAAFRREMDEATDDDVKAARESVIDLESRIGGLDMAWERTLKEMAAESVARRVVAAKAAHGKMSAEIEKRAKLSAQMKFAAEALADLFVEYQALGRGILVEAMNHREAFNGDSLQHLRDLVDGSFNDIRKPLARVLGQRGLDLTGFAFKGYPTDHETHRDIGAFVTWQNKRVAGHVEALADPEVA